MSAVIVHCSCPDVASAERIARTLVEERLAACVQRLPGVASTYRWRETVETSSEVLLLIKTAQPRLDALMARIAALHPYEVPELLAVGVVEGWHPYLRWLEDATATS